MEDILAIILIFGGGTLVLLAISPIGRAIADRIRYGAQVGAGTDPQLLEELDALRADVAELHERVDFAERMLAKPRETNPAEPPAA